ncbi:hypothetical protein MCEMSEM18_03332 [Comamonadaceae bacterium]
MGHRLPSKAVAQIADSILVRDIYGPASDAKYLNNRPFPKSQNIDQRFAFVAESTTQG